jgi:hypothetical protein
MSSFKELYESLMVEGNDKLLKQKTPLTVDQVEEILNTDPKTRVTLDLSGWQLERDTGSTSIKFKWKYLKDLNHLPKDDLRKLSKKNNK